MAVASVYTCSVLWPAWPRWPAIAAICRAGRVAHPNVTEDEDYWKDYPSIPEYFHPCCASRIFSLYSAVFMKLNGKKKILKVDVFLLGKSLKLEFPLPWVSCGLPGWLCAWARVFQESSFLLARVPDLGTWIAELLTLGLFGLAFSFFSRGLLFLAY